jgi:N-methylhydantoinase B/acetone carboxylase alpha subunit
MGKPCSILTFEIGSVGGGACAIKDGLDYAAAMWNPEGDMADVEIWEILEPLVYLGRRVKPNTAGPGKYRGGSGFESLRMVWKTNDLLLQNCGDGAGFSSAGLFGGYPSATGYRHNVHNTDTVERAREGNPYPVREYDPGNSELSAQINGDHKFDKHTLTYPYSFKQGDLYLSWMRGGGGLGDTLERHPQKVVDDVNHGFLLPRYASEIYGVKLKSPDTPSDQSNTRDRPPDYSLDEKGTQELRQEIRKQRAERSMPASEFLEKEKERVHEGRLAEHVREMYNQSMALSPAWARYFREYWGLPDDFTFKTGDES